MKKLNYIIITILLSCILLSGCYDRKELDDLTYIMAIGLDKGTTNNLRMTLQYAVPLAIGGGGGSSGGGGGPKSVSNVTVECPSLYAGLNMINNFVGKQVTFSHAKLIIFSEELIQGGQMVNIVRAFLRGREFRPNMYVAVSRGSAEDYIKSVIPIQEADPSKYYELKFSAYTYTGFTANTQIHNFIVNTTSPAIQPVATLIGVGKYEASKDFIDKSTALTKGRPNPLEGDYKAGDIPKTGDIKGETMGLAVFDGLNLVGELDGAEATNYLMATGEFKHAYMTFPDPQAKDRYIILDVKQSRKPVRRVEFVDGKPKIDIKVMLEADFLSIQSGINYENVENTGIFEKSTQEFLKMDIEKLLSRTTKEFHSDICGFGKETKSKFLTWNEWARINWLGIYKDSSFNVNVNLKVRRPGLMIRSSPIFSSEGERK